METFVAMKTLIAYCSRHGSAEKIAHLLFTEIDHGTIRLLDLGQEAFPNDLQDFDQVIIGGSIHYGQIQPVVQRFCQQFHQELMQKKLGLYMCYMLDDQAEEEFNNAYPESLRNHALALGYFGGELLIDKMNFIEKFVVRRIMKESEPVFHLDEVEVDSFLTKIKA